MTGEFFSFFFQILKVQPCGFMFVNTQTKCQTHKEHSTLDYTSKSRNENKHLLVVANYKDSVDPALFLVGEIPYYLDINK